MESDDLTQDQLKEIMRVMSMLAANIENWKYVAVNAEYLDKKRVSDALNQMVNIFTPFVTSMQTIVEVEALTKLDPYDLI